MNAEQFREFLRSTLPAMGYRWRRFDRRNLRRKVQRRMEALGLHEARDYARHLQTSREERAHLESLLRVTITRFFRNGWLWSWLEEALPGEEARLGEGETFAVWSGGCAGGEEAYSAAMLLHHLTLTHRFRHPWSVTGTDTDLASLNRSTGACYGQGTVREVPPVLRERWFVPEGESWSLRPELRGMVNFRYHDLVKEPPPGKYHAVFLRNTVLTYNVDPVARKVLEKIRGCLRGPGLLVIGRTEKLPEGSGFKEVSKCIYRKDGG